MSVLYKNTCRVVSCDVPRQQKTAYDQGGCVRKGRGRLTYSVAYNVEPVTNTSSSSCANNGRRGVLDARCRSSRLCFLHFATRTVDNIVDLYAVKPNIRLESRFLPTPNAFDAHVWRVPVEISPRRFVWKK